MNKMLASLAVLSVVAAPTVALAKTKEKPHVEKVHKKKDKAAPATPAN